MKKIYQQTSKDCIRATFASIFELELEEVPDFNLELPEGDSEELNKRINAWLQPFNLRFTTVFERATYPFPEGVIHEMSGKPEGAGFYHSVVGIGGKEVFDVCPGGLQIKNDLALGLFLVLDVSKPTNPPKSKL
jgi:hypothetical protein